MQRALQPDDPAARDPLGRKARAAVQRRDFAGALPNVQRITELEPKNPLGWALVSECEVGLGRNPEALVAAKKSTTVSPASAAGWLQVKRLEKSLGHNLECLHALSHAVDLSPDNAPMLATIGYGYHQSEPYPGCGGPVAARGEVLA